MRRLTHAAVVLALGAIPLVGVVVAVHPSGIGGGDSGTASGSVRVLADGGFIPVGSAYTPADDGIIVSRN
jgi:hypothetical protein